MEFVNFDTLNKKKIDILCKDKIIKTLHKLETINKRNKYNNIKNIEKKILNNFYIDSTKYKILFDNSLEKLIKNIILNIIHSYTQKKKQIPHIVSTTAESKHINKILKYLELKKLCYITLIPPNLYGVISKEIISKSIKYNTCAVILTYTNNILGTINNIPSIGSMLHNNDIPLIVDCDNIIGYKYLDLNIENIDILFYNFNSIYGPEDLSVSIINNELISGYNLYLNDLELSKYNIYPQIESSEICLKYLKKKSIKNINNINKNFKNIIIDELNKKFKYIKYINLLALLNNSDYINNYDDNIYFTVLEPDIDNYNDDMILSNIFSFSIYRKNGNLISNERIKKELKKKKIIISLGDNTNNLNKSDNILLNLKIPEDIRRGFIRISFSINHKEDNITKLIKNIIKIINNIK